MNHSTSLTLSILALASALFGVACAADPSAQSGAGVTKAAIVAGASCQTGASHEADDGCNTCTCVASSWQCTELACEEAGSDELSTPEVEGDPPTNHHADEVFSGALDSACADGDAIAPDHCNTCICANGGWSCTELACDPPGNHGGSGNDASADLQNAQPECKAGDSTTFDNCNNCECYDGHWSCTELACEN